MNRRFVTNAWGTLIVVAQTSWPLKVAKHWWHLYVMFIFVLNFIKSRDS